MTDPSVAAPRVQGPRIPGRVESEQRHRRDRPVRAVRGIPWRAAFDDSDRLATALSFDDDLIADVRWNARLTEAPDRDERRLDRIRHERLSHSATASTTA
jgi:hypothetical protein